MVQLEHHPYRSMTLDFRHVVNKWLVLTVLVIWLSWPFIDDTTSDLQIACTKN